MKPHLAAHPYRLDTSTGHRGADTMTRKTFLFTRRLLVILSAVVSLVLVIYLEILRVGIQP
jgi:hypothetical protein